MLTSTPEPLLGGRATRGHNAGSIYRRRGRNRWCASVTLADGRRIERQAEWHDNTEARAREILRELLEERDADLVPARKLTLAGWLRSWIAGMERSGETRPATLRSYRYVAARVTPELGATRLVRLGPAAIERWLDALSGAPRTVELCRDVLRAALNDAVRRRILARSPMVSVAIAPVPAHRATVLGVEEARRILEDPAPDWYHALWVTLLATGLRISEALALTWDDFDRSGGTLAVRAQLAWDGADWVRVPTKAGRTLERIALPRFAIEALVAHERAMALARKPRWTHFGHIFVTRHGTPPHKVGPELDDLTTRLGLPRITPHELRSAHLTLLADAGVPEDVRQRRAGHATTAMARRYTTGAALADAEAAATLDGTLRRTS